MSKPNAERGKPKKKFVPPTENERAKQEYMELDAEEIEHRRQLDVKYRDRAKERREKDMFGEGEGEGEGGEEEEQDNFDDENLVVKEGGREYHTKIGGLDFDLLRKQKEEEERANIGDHLARVQELIKRRDGIPAKTTGKKELKAACRSMQALNIQKVLFREDAKKESKRNIFKPANCYEFDINFEFGNNLPKLVIRSRDAGQTEQKPVSAQIGENVLTKVAKIMTYIKTGKKPDHKKQLIEERKAQESTANPISTQDMSDDDEDSIFPDAKKKVKRDEAPTSSRLFPEEETREERGDQKTMKGIFASVRGARQDEDMAIEEKEDVLNIKQITEKNKELLEQMARKKAEEKLAQLQSKDDGYYMECFPEDAPELEDLKNQQKKIDGMRKGANKSKKKELNKQFDKVTKIMTEKRGGGGD